MVTFSWLDKNDVLRDRTVTGPDENGLVSHPTISPHPPKGPAWLGAGSSHNRLRISQCANCAKCGLHISMSDLDGQPCEQP